MRIKPMNGIRVERREDGLSVSLNVGTPEQVHVILSWSNLITIFATAMGDAPKEIVDRLYQFARLAVYGTLNVTISELSDRMFLAMGFRARQHGCNAVRKDFREATGQTSTVSNENIAVSELVDSALLRRERESATARQFTLGL